MTSRYAALAHVHSINPDKINRSAGDFYRTPRVGIERLLDVEDFDDIIWEPACGDGAISEVLKERGHRVKSSDLYDRGYGVTGIDFLTCTPYSEFSSIITNPPFKLAEAFARRALEVTPKKVALLARLLWLEGKKRREFFLNSPLSRVWVSSTRLNVSRDGKDYGDGGEGGMVAFAWYVWERGHVGPPTLGWLP